MSTAVVGEPLIVPKELSVRFAVRPAPARSLSPTSAATWAQCELKYALSYLFGWQEPSTLPQLIGNAVHRGVELLYGLPQGSRDRTSASELLRAATDEELIKPTYAQLIAGSGDLTTDLIAAGEDALDGLFALEDPDYISVGPDGLEVWVEATLYGAPVRGRIDRIYDASGAEVVADYKTGRVPAPRYVTKAFFGLWTYAAALAAADPDHHLADRIELLYLVGRERLSRPVLREVALDQAKQLARTWRAIETVVMAETATVTARTSKLCDWCAFQPACPAFTTTPEVGSAEHDALLNTAGLTQRTQRKVADATERLEQPTPEETP